jgi:hypothetical protein
VFRGMNIGLERGVVIRERGCGCVAYVKDDVSVRPSLVFTSVSVVRPRPVRPSARPTTRQSGVVSRGSCDWMAGARIHDMRPAILVRRS